MQRVQKKTMIQNFGLKIQFWQALSDVVFVLDSYCKDLTNNINTLKNINDNLKLQSVFSSSLYPILI